MIAKTRVSNVSLVAVESVVVVETFNVRSDRYVNLRRDSARMPEGVIAKLGVIHRLREAVAILVFACPCKMMMGMRWETFASKAVSRYQMNVLRAINVLNSKRTPWQ